MPYKGLAADAFPMNVAKTASYLVKATDHGLCFTNEGAGGAIVFTLPPVATVSDGWNIEVLVVADQTVTVTAPAGLLIAFNNAAATSIAYSTSVEKIGGAIEIRYIASAGKYFAKMSIGTETQTPVVS
jgi:hypothetical protein